MMPATNSGSFTMPCMKPTRKDNLQKNETLKLNAKPITENFSTQLESVVSPYYGQKDGRNKVYKTAEWPCSVHGVVACRYKGSIGWGSGTLIAHNIVYTAAHNLYDRHNKAYAEVVEFLPAMNGTKTPFGKIQVKDYFVPVEYVESGEEDYALLLLESSIAERTGHFGLKVLKPEELKTKRVNITGYPSDKVNDGNFDMYTMGKDNAISFIKDGKLGYTIDTAPGQSGSAIWYEEKGNYYVVGVHVEGGVKVNLGTLLTETRYDIIKRWIQLTKLKAAIQKGDFTWENHPDFEQISSGKFNVTISRSRQVDIKRAEQWEYVGEIKNGRRHGIGMYEHFIVKAFAERPEWKFEWALPKLKEKYTGEWKNDVFDGYGKCEDSFGNYYEGEWRDGKRHGKGKYVHKKYTKIGEWENGQPEGVIKKTYRNGKEVTQVYKHGKKLSSTNTHCQMF